MDHLQKITSQARTRLAMMLLINNGLLLATWWISAYYLHLGKNETLIVVGTIAFIALTLIAWISAPHVIQPLRLVWQAVLHIAPDTVNQKAPNLKNIHYGRELITAMVGHIYQLANVANTVEKIAQNTRHDLSGDFVANSLPLPLVVLDKDMNVIFANEALLSYTKRTAGDTIGQNIYLILDMLFSNQHTFDSWLETVRGRKVTATRTWERVRINLPETKETHSCDLVAYYNSDNPDGFEIMLTLFDRTRQYDENNQLTLKLREEPWAPLLQRTVADVELRARVRGIRLDLKIDDNLPNVAVDAVSIYEVITNLLDNAIKYSKPNGQVLIRSYLTSDGNVETTIQDTGVGIPEGAISSLFDKFYRDYRNRSQVGGTGMGLYLCKAIISAHEGNIWVRSKEGQGSTFGFSIQPYANLEHSDKKDNSNSLTRIAHGWIKNHSMYRR